MTPEKKKLIDKADNILSIYIRKRDCKNGFGRCISCGCRITFETCDNGHYIPRANMSTRFDERNCNAQCHTCNRMEYGNLKGYTKGLMDKYGNDIIDELFSLKHATLKLSKSDLQEIIKKYQTKTKEL